MKTQTFNFLCVFFCLVLTSFTSALDDQDLLKSTLINPIETLNDGIYNDAFDIEKNTSTYFSYDVSNHKGENNVVLTINSPVSAKMDLKCILSDLQEEKAIEQFEKQDNDCYFFKHKNDKIVNIICPMSNFKDGYILYLKLKSDVEISNLNFYVREAGSYQTEIETKDLKNTLAYYAFELPKKDCINKQYLLTSSELNSIVIFGLKGKEVTQLDETSFLLLSSQTLAAHFWDYDKVILFVGETEMKEKNEINLNLSEMDTEKIYLYYYTGYDFENSFISFHNDCTDEESEHYLIVNYGEFSKEDFYFKFHNLIGSNVFFSEYTLGKVDITKLDFSEVGRFKYLKQTENHIHIFKLKCSSKGSKIIANIKYNVKTDKVDNGEANEEVIKDFSHTFGKSEFTLDYSKLISANQTEFQLEIFTPTTTEAETFQINFEGKDLEMNNKFSKILKIENKEITSLKIKKEGELETVISVSPSLKQKVDSSQKYFTIHTYSKNNTAFFVYYEMEHEFDANYNISLEIKNENDEIIPICYYLSTTSLIHNFGQNCFLLPAQTSDNILLNNIFTISGKTDFNLEEPQYTLVIYNYNKGGLNYKISDLNYETNLPKSIPINNRYKDHDFLFLNTSIKKNEDSYFHLQVENSEEARYFDLYILDDVSKFDKMPFELVCISAYEMAIKYIEPLFTEDNNLCHIINEKDYNSNVFHIIYKKSSNKTNENLIIKIKSEEDLNIEFVTDINNSVKNDFDFVEGIHKLKEPSVYTIFEISREKFAEFKDKQIILYNKDDKIEFHGRNHTNIKMLAKSNLVIIDDVKKNYEKYFLIFGRNNCTYYCNKELNYQLVFADNVLYQSTNKFEEYQHLAVNINKCKKDELYYLIFDYGRKKTKESMSLAEYTISGDLENGEYIDSFATNEFDSGKLALNNYQVLNENDLNLNILRFTCKNNLFSYFDYFIKTDNKKDIDLEQGSIKHFILQKKTNYTFKYESINEIKIDLIEKNTEKPSIVFEGKGIDIEEGEISLTLNRTDKDINQLYIAASESADIPIRITAYVNNNNLEKTKIDNLYKFNKKYIYDIPNKAKNVTLYLKNKSSRLRLLLEEGGDTNEKKICYNAAGFIILDENDVNCFNMKEDSEINYIVPENRENDTKAYLVVYPADNNQEINIDKVESFIDEESGDNEHEGDNDKDNKTPTSGNEGVKWYWVVIIIVAILLVILLIVCIIAKIKKKRLSSKDIEKDVNRTKSLEIID